MLQKQPAAQQNHIPTIVVVEGKVHAKNLQQLNLTEKWLDNALKQLNIPRKSDILYAEVQANGRLHVQLTGEENT